MYFKSVIALLIFGSLDLATTVPVPDEDSSLENEFAVGDAIKKEIKTVMGATCVTDGGCSIISYCYKETLIEGLGTKHSQLPEPSFSSSPGQTFRRTHRTLDGEKEVVRKQLDFPV